jgi:uncharacterized protein YaiI (UPF0178 family)
MDVDASTPPAPEAAFRVAPRIGMQQQLVMHRSHRPAAHGMCRNVAVEEDRDDDSELQAALERARRLRQSQNTCVGFCTCT